MTSAVVSAIVNLIISLAGAFCYFLVGWLWSASTWRHSFDLGWLVVAFILGRYASMRIEGGKLKLRDYVSVCLPALPGFMFEFLADWGLHDFRLYGGLGALVRFAAFSCSLLVFVAGLTAIPRFGVGLGVLSKKDEVTWRSTIQVGGCAIAVAFSIGTVLVFVSGSEGLDTKASVLQSWFYWASLIVYFLLTLKMMLPLVLRRLRTVIDQINQPDMRF
jgi:hypothetical protein